MSNVRCPIHSGAHWARARRGRSKCSRVCRTGLAQAHASPGTVARMGTVTTATSSCCSAAISCMACMMHLATARLRAFLMYI